MWFSRGGAARTATAAVSGSVFVRYFSRKRAVNVRKINPKVPHQEAYSIARGLYDVIRTHGPLTVGNTWTHAQVTRSFRAYRVAKLGRKCILSVSCLFTISGCSEVLTVNFWEEVANSNSRHNSLSMILIQ